MSRRLFRYLWRFNAIVIAVLGAVALVAAMFAFSETWFYRYQDDQLPPVEIAGRVSEKLELGDLTEVKGTPYLVTAVRTPGYAGSGSSAPFGKRGDESVDLNLIVIDTLSASSQLVFPTNHQRVVRWEVLEGDGGKGTALLALVRRDEIPKTFDVFVHNFETARQAWVARNIDAWDAARLTSDGRLVALMSRKAGYHFIQIDLATLLSKETPLALTSATKTQ